MMRPLSAPCGDASPYPPPRAANPAPWGPLTLHSAQCFRGAPLPGGADPAPLWSPAPLSSLTVHNPFWNHHNTQGIRGLTTVKCGGSKEGTYVCAFVSNCKGLTFIRGNVISSVTRVIPGISYDGGKTDRHTTAKCINCHKLKASGSVFHTERS